MNGNVWKVMASLLAGIVITGVAAWITFGADGVERPEMVEYVEHEMQPVRGSLGVVQQKLDEVEDLQREQLVEQAKLGSKVDLVLEQLKD